MRDKYWIHVPEVGDTIAFGQAPEHLSEAQVARGDAGQEFELEIDQQETEIVETDRENSNLLG